MERPTGVTVLAVLCFIGAGFAVLGGIGMLFVGGLGMAGAASRPGMAMLAGMGAFAGVFLLVMAALDVIVGVGLWKLLSWGRILALVLVGVGAVLAVLGLFSALVHFRPFAVLWQIVVAAIYLLIIWYLTRPHVKQAFGQ